VPAMVVLVMFVPWTIRNEVRMHAFIPTSTNTGDTLCLDRNMTAQGGFRFADHDGCVDPNLPEVPRNSGNTRKAIEFVTHHPAREALQIVRRAKLMFNGDHDGLYATGSLHGGPALEPGHTTSSPRPPIGTSSSCSCPRSRGSSSCSGDRILRS